MKILIVDDEPATGHYLKGIIQQVPGVEEVYLATSGKEALCQAEAILPNVIFLDIEMPEMNGLEVAHILAKKNVDIFFVFATAYPDYAIQAFKLYSFDYILKPFNPERIKKTVIKLRDRLYQSSSFITQTSTIKIEIGKQKVLLKPEEILYIESCKMKKVSIKTLKIDYMINRKLYDMEKEMEQYGFFRCHRTYLVNLKHIKEITPTGRSFQILLSSGDIILLSRQHERLLREKIGKSSPRFSLRSDSNK